MRCSLYLLIFFCLSLSNVVVSADANSQWMVELHGLADTFPVSKETKESVMSSLAKWDPEQCGIKLRLAMWFRDLYLNDEAVNGVVRGSFYPRLMTRGYTMATGHAPVGPNLLVLSHATVAGLDVLKNVHRLPYLFFADDCSDIANTADIRGCAKSFCAVMSHACAITAELSQCNDEEPSQSEGAVQSMWSSCASGLSYAFAGATMMLAAKGDFTGVILRSYKRLYEQQGNEEKQALIEHMIAKRKATKKRIAKNN
jgi:hypothetical protein